jgi:hypothetical protein
MAVAIDTGDIFRLRNDSKDRDLVIPATLTYKQYVVPPGKTALVPFEVIRVWWGDPRCRPQVYTRFRDSGIPNGQPAGVVNKREEEIRRLGVLYGSYCTDVDTLLSPDYDRGSAHYGEPKVVPHPVSIQTENGDPVIPACFDRSGENVYPVVNTSVEELTDEVAYRQYLERRLDEMKSELNRISGSDDAEVDAGAR